MSRFMEKVRMREATSIAALVIAGMAWGLNGFANAAEPKLNFALPGLLDGIVGWGADVTSASTDSLATSRGMSGFEVMGDLGKSSAG